jgi:hypothetical protein
VSHFTVIACVRRPDDLERALAPFDENREVEPYPDYEEGAPAGYWAVRSLREHEGLSADDATLTWEQVAEAANRRYPEESPLLVSDAGRAYTMSTRNPGAKWDWWVVGGRWPGRFIYRQEFEAQAIEPKPHWGAPDETIPPLHCDGGPKRALDLGALREEKAVQARKTYAEWRTVTAGTPDALPWSAFADNISPERGYTADEAREEYRSQPRVQAIKDTDFSWHDDAIAEFQIPESLYVERQRAQAVPGWAILTADGRWMEQGRMGWWAMNDATEGSRIGYWEAANAYIESLPDDTWLIAVDCHI